MPVSRYNSTPRLAFGSQLGTSMIIAEIRAGVKSGAIPVETILVRGSERLDTIAGVVYGDAAYWWILAAASGIGWGLQVPPGTVVKVPQLESILSLLG